MEIFLPINEYKYKILNTIGLIGPDTSKLDGPEKKISDQNPVRLLFYLVWMILVLHEGGGVVYKSKKKLVIMSNDSTNQNPSTKLLSTGVQHYLLL